MFDGKRAVLALMFAGLAIVACVPVAFGATTILDSQFPNAEIDGDCNGNPIVVMMAGSVHTVIGSSINPNGMTHSTVDVTVQANGVDQAGINYVVHENIHSEANTHGAAMEQSFGSKMKMVSQGPAPNLTDRIILHVVTDSNGNTKVDKSSETITCK
jgi:hypothetical protein